MQKKSVIFLILTIHDRFDLCIMNAPVAVRIGFGQLSYDIVSGDPEESIMVH